MKILMLSESSYPLHPGGSGKTSHLLAAALAERGHRVHLVSLIADEHARRETLDGVDVIRLADRPATPGVGRDRRAARDLEHRLAKRLDLDAIDIVHDSGGFLSYFLSLAERLRSQFGSRVVMHFRYLLHRHQAIYRTSSGVAAASIDACNFETNIHETTQCFGVRTADHVLCPSHDDATFVDAAYRPTRLSVLPDPIDPHFLQAPTPSPSRDRTLLFRGAADNHLKGAEIVLEAFPKLRTRYPDLRLMVVGGGGESFAERLGHDRVMTLPWLDDATAMANAYARATVVVAPSHYESFGLMAIEAMAAGRPVVAAPVGGMRDVIDDSGGGLLFPERHPSTWSDALVDAVSTLLDDPTHVQELADRGHRYVRDRLMPSHIATRLETLYKELIERKHDATRPHLTAPSWSRDDQLRYLDTANTWARAANPAIEEDNWRNDIDHHCTGCTRDRIATGLLALRQGTPSAPVCPLAVLQQRLVRDHQERLGDLT
ncbi:MAG: glycosyltransferase family 4 protein [Acidobacteriota bacterium]